ASLPRCAFRFPSTEFGFSALGSRLSALAFRLSAFGSRLSAFGSRLSTSPLRSRSILSPVLCHQFAGVLDSQPAHQQRELFLERRADRLPRVLSQAPHLVFEGANGLLPRLVEELLLGVVRRAFGAGISPHPLVHLGLQGRRKQ